MREEATIRAVTWYTLADNSWPRLDANQYNATKADYLQQNVTIETRSHQIGIRPGRKPAYWLERVEATVGHSIKSGVLRGRHRQGWRIADTYLKRSQVPRI